MTEMVSYRRGDGTDPGAQRVTFYRNPVTDTDHVKIQYPGNTLQMPDFEVEEVHKVRWPQAWAAYQAGTEEFEGQTMLEAVPWLDPSRHHHLRSQHIHTIEALAAVTDGNLPSLGMGGRELRERAREHVDRERKADSFDDLQRQIDELESRLAAKDGKAAAKGAGA